MSPWMAFVIGVVAAVAAAFLWRAWSGGRDVTDDVVVGAAGLARAVDLPDRPRLPDAPRIPDAPIPVPK